MLILFSGSPLASNLIWLMACSVHSSLIVVAKWPVLDTWTLVFTLKPCVVSDCHFDPNGLAVLYLPHWPTVKCFFLMFSVSNIELESVNITVADTLNRTLFL